MEGETKDKVTQLPRTTSIEHSIKRDLRKFINCNLFMALASKNSKYQIKISPELLWTGS